MTDDKPYKPGEVIKSGTALPDHYKFTMKHIKFLDNYAKTLDEKKAAKAADVGLRTVRESWLKQERFQAELQEIHKVYQKNIRMTAEHATAKHIELMDKMEKHLDMAGDDTDKAAKVMNPLAKMSDSRLKATGKFQQEQQSQGVSVNINITKTKEEDIIIDGEVLDDSEDNSE